MNYYFIYSAGGGGGDWNGLKRIWKDSMPESIKSSILLKFGDIFFNHVSSNNITRPNRWSNITDLRAWLFEATNDSYVLNNSDILLDSGSAKIVGWIAHHNPNISCKKVIDIFNNIINDNYILEKYVDIIINSKITYAITFDIPNPFKIRSQNGDTKLNILDNSNNKELIKASAIYANKIYSTLKAKAPNLNVDNILMTTVNGTWSLDEFILFFELLDYEPKNLAIGGLSSMSASDLTFLIPKLKKLNLNKYIKVHFLGCGGLKKISVLKQSGFSDDYFSVDVSTPINRSIDGNKQNTSFSAYYDYSSLSMYRIKDDTRDKILNLHINNPNTLFSNKHMEEIIDDIIIHQHGESSDKTYDSRAKLIIHNNDVYKQYAKK